MRDVLVLGQASFHQHELNKMHAVKDPPAAFFFDVFVTCLQITQYMDTVYSTSQNPWPRSCRKQELLTQTLEYCRISSVNKFKIYFLLGTTGGHIPPHFMFRLVASPIKYWVSVFTLRLILK